MTQVVVIELGEDGKLPGTKIIEKRVANQLEGAVNVDGTWKKGWELPGQAYIRIKEPGKYEVVHNFNRKDYCLSVSLLTQPGTFEILEMNDVLFRIITKDGDGKVTPQSFRFAINFVK